MFVTDKAVLQYIEDHGFGSPTPPLTKKLSSDVFREHYYNKKELMNFCRDVGISALGLKEDLNKRIELYLRTGYVTVVQPADRCKIADSQGGLSLDQQVVNYKSDMSTRTFFAQHIPEFAGFSALVQKQVKQRVANGDVFTYADAIGMHKKFMRNKVRGNMVKVVYESCQYNQFFMDYKADQSPKLHSNQEAWMLTRNSAGSKTYERYQQRINEIRNILSAI